MLKKAPFVSLVRIILLILAALAIILFFTVATQAQVAETLPLTQTAQVRPTVEDYVDFMEYWLTFRQIIGEASQKEKIEVIYPKAIRELEEFIKHKPQSRWAIEAKMRIAEIHQLSSIVIFPVNPGEIKLNKNWRIEASRWLLDIVENHPDYRYFNAVRGVETDEFAGAWALYCLAMWNNDPAHLKQLIEKYPTNEDAKFVAKNFDAISDNLKNRGFLGKIIQEIEAGRQEMEKIVLRHSSKRVRCQEIRRRSDGRETKHTYYDFTWKEVALKVFNLENGQTQIIKIKKAGLGLINIQPGFIVTLEKRPSGIRWNGRNTAYRVNGASGGGGWAVILNKYPTRLKNGQRRDTVYVPYSTALQQAITVRRGGEFLGRQILLSLMELGRLKAENSAELFIIEKTDGSLASSAIERLALIEHTDYFEFKEFVAGRWPYSPFDRVLTILALNGPDAFSATPSPASASGLMQFTNKSRRGKSGTWDLVRTKYKWAELPPFEIGVKNQIESIKAAILLHNFNLGELIKELGTEILKDNNVEHYLAAAYNGGVGPVVKAIKHARTTGTDWRRELRKLKKTNESFEYLEKLDYLLKTRTP